MRVLPDPLGFEWDEANSDKNFVLHHVSNQEAEEVFLNHPNFIFEDQKHSALEKRYGLWGETNKGRGLTVIFTIRQGKIRIISARDISRKERRFYEKVKKTS